MKCLVFGLCMYGASVLAAVGSGKNVDFNQCGRSVDTQNVPVSSDRKPKKQKVGAPEQQETAGQKLDRFVCKRTKMDAPPQPNPDINSYAELLETCRKKIIDKFIGAASKEGIFLGGGVTYVEFLQNAKEGSKEWLEYFRLVMGKCIEEEFEGHPGKAFWNNHFVKSDFCSHVEKVQKEGETELKGILEGNTSLDLFILPFRERFLDPLCGGNEERADSNRQTEDSSNHDSNQAGISQDMPSDQKSDESVEGNCFQSAYANQEKSDNSEEDDSFSQEKSEKSMKEETSTQDKSESLQGKELIQQPRHGDQPEDSYSGAVLNDFLNGLSRRVVGQLRLVKSTTDFDAMRECWDEVKHLVEATVKCYIPKPENGTLKFLREVYEKSQNKSLDFEPKSAGKFFSHFSSDLLERLHNAFASWEESPRLKVVMLWGKAGVGKTESLQWLFERSIGSNVAAVTAGPGQSLVGDSSSIGLFDVLLSRSVCWKCLHLTRELGKTRNSSLEELMNRLYLINDEVCFHSPYFGVFIPVKNVVIVCTSNFENPVDDEYLMKKQNKDRVIDYEKDGIRGKVEYGAFDTEWVRNKVGRMYGSELDKRFVNGREMWQRIQNSNEESLSVAEQRLQEDFEDQIGERNLRKDTVIQKVSSFIIRGGSDGWLSRNGGE